MPVKNAPPSAAVVPPANLKRNAREPEEMIPLGDEVEDVEAAPVPDDADIRGVAQLASDMTDLEREIAALEAELARKREAHKAIREGSLPLKMAELGMEEFKLTGGGRIEIIKMTAASITELNRPKAHEWLEKDGSGSIIKKTITIEFGKGEEAWAKKFLADLAKRKKPLKHTLKEAVHYQTLQKFVRDKLAEAKSEGLDAKQFIPHDLFGIFQVTYAEHTPPKD